jgi:hypothetical protein
MKAVSPLVGFVLTIFVSVMTIGLVYFGIKPAMERSVANNVMSEARGNLELLASTIERVASGAEGSKSVVSLSVSDGEYFIDKNSNNIIFTFEPSVDLGVIGRIGDKFLEKGLVFFDFFNNYLDNSFPKNLINISGNWRVYNNRLEGINGTAYYFIDKNLNGFYVSSNFGSDNNLGEIFVSPVNLSGLVLYLTFDEGSGNIVYDYSGNGNNGIINLGQRVSGRFGNGVNFNGTDGCVWLSSTFPKLSANKTIIAWISRNINSRATIFAVDDADWGWRGYAFAINYNKLYFRVGNGIGAEIKFGSIIVPTNMFSFVAAIYENSSNSVTFFINEVKDGPYYFSTPNTWNISQYGPRIGGEDCRDNEVGLNGTIDEVMVFNRSLTDDEIKFLYQEGLKKLQNSGMIQFSSQIKPYIAISNPSGKIYVENLRVGNQNSKEIKLIKPFYNLEFDSNFRFSKGNHQIKIENIGFNSTSKRPIIRISEE